MGGSSVRSRESVAGLTLRVVGALERRRSFRRRGRRCGGLLNIIIDHHCLFAVLACAWAGRLGVKGLCSYNEVPKPPANSEWDPERSNVKCTQKVCIAEDKYTPSSSNGDKTLCPYNTGSNFRPTVDDCIQTHDDHSECYCRTCCAHMPATWQCDWARSNDEPMREPGNLFVGDKCTAKCQRGYKPKDPRTPSEEFTCTASSWHMEPTVNSTFGCIEDNTQKCGTAPPCEGVGCKWAGDCIDLGHIDSTCQAQCRDGYVPKNGLPRTLTYECKEAQKTDGWEWAVVGGGKPLECLRKCSDTPSPLSRHIWRSEGGADKTFCGLPPYTNQTCKVECKHGYHWANDVNPLCKTDTSACPFDGLECCDCFKSVCGVERLHSSEDCITCMHSHGDDVCPGCAVDLQKDWCQTPQNPDDVGWYKCAGGDWVRKSANTECKCIANECAATKNNELVAGASACPAHVFNSNQTISGCDLHCLDGYEKYSGSGKYRCSSDGSFVPTSNKLVCKQSCEQRLPVPHADPRGCTGRDGRLLPIVGEICTAQCEPGWVGNGQFQYLCAPDSHHTAEWVPNRAHSHRKEFQCHPASALPNTDDEWTKVILCVVVAVWLLCIIWWFGLYPACVVDRLCPRPGHSPASVLRQSFLGGSHKLAATQLAERDVQARWLLAERLMATSDDEVDDFEPEPVPETRTACTNASSQAKRRVPKAASETGPLPVMFTNDHVRELQPRTWLQTPLGTGTYGIVYKATWRGRGVAVKVLKLPERGQATSSTAEEMLKQNVQKVMDEFVTEVEICCDLNHPNLARLLGYADHPQLMMVQELLKSSVDKALYVDMWTPTVEQVLKSALDVARGMNYLHTAFKMQSSNHTQPIIHRDLKTPNLLLATDPLRTGEPVVIKITDFGLSRDKGMGSTFNQTIAMTGCGSVLWMAPEILLGSRYNEKVDVYSYAMVLVELVSRQLPWSGVEWCHPASVPTRVTKNERPFQQIKALRGTAVQSGLKDLICKCWHPRPEARPAFSEVKAALKRLRALHRQGDAPVQPADESSGDAVQQGARSVEPLVMSHPVSPSMPALVEGLE